MPQPKNDVNKKPVGGYAAGDYNCTCCKCGDLFAGDKRAVTCAACAYGARIHELEEAMQKAVPILVQKSWHLNMEFFTASGKVLGDMAEEFKQLLTPTTDPKP